jgi:GNAT superfamily N-acetyltransferase
MGADEIELTGYTPGVVGWVVGKQATYYYENWGLGLYFEAKAAAEMAEFLSRFDPAHDGAWIARVNGATAGAIFIDGKQADSEGARLRWFIVDPAYQGKGVGGRLMNAAMDFCRHVGFRRVYLTTFSGLNAARHLYEKAGFRLCAEMDGHELTGAALVEQIFELTSPPRP